MPFPRKRESSIYNGIHLDARLRGHDKNGKTIVEAYFNTPLPNHYHINYLASKIDLIR